MYFQIRIKFFFKLVIKKKDKIFTYISPKMLYHEMGMFSPFIQLRLLKADNILSIHGLH